MSVTIKMLNKKTLFIDGIAISSINTQGTIVSDGCACYSVFIF